ncbi:Kinesin-like protein KIF21A, partial [Toxocara canis]
ESEARIQQLEQEARINESLLSQVIEDKDIVDDLSQVLEAAQRNHSKSHSPEAPEQNNVNGGLEVESDSAKDPSMLAEKSSNVSFNLGEKARRRTATTDELLYPIKASRSLEEIRELDDVPEGERTRSNSPVSAEVDTECDSRPDSTCPPSTSHVNKNNSATNHPRAQQHGVLRMAYSRNAPYRSTIATVSSTSKLQSLKKRSNANNSGWSRFHHPSEHRDAPSTSATSTRQMNSPYSVFARLFQSKDGNGSPSSLLHGWSRFMQRQKSISFANRVDVSNGFHHPSEHRDAPSTSATSTRQMNSPYSVFARLFQSKDGNGSPSSLLHGKVGRILPYTARTATGQRDRTAASRLLVRTHTLDGHTRAVLSVSANDTTVITGSKDRLAKLWDLERGIERCTLGLHQNNVTCVRLIPNGHLALSVSMSTVRVWDLRTEKCVYVLHSSGLAAQGEAVLPSPSRQNTVPISETVINAAEPDPTGRLLFTTFCGDVRIWNLEKFAAIGRLTAAAHGPRSEVSCLAVTGDYIPRVFTGSRDHYVKMYDVEPLDQVVFEARVEFNPPHYDNVTAILPYGDALFTASKDANIMRFSLRDMKRDHLELRAHEKWILDMCLLHAGRPLLTTACKAGCLKVWDFTSTRKLRLVEELNRAHEEAINSIAATSSSIVFTASNDTTVGLWRLSEEAL